jgi:hypothetical protein
VPEALEDVTGERPHCHRDNWGRRKTSPEDRT